MWRVFGGSSHEAWEAGAGGTQQFGYGILSALAELGTEKLGNVSGIFRKAFGKGVGDGVIDRFIGKFGASAAGKTILKWLASAGSEGIEELISGAVNPALRTIYNNPPQRVPPCGRSPF